MVRKLEYTELKKVYQIEDFNFKTTKDVESFTDLIGQERASRAIKFGLNMDNKGYNIYVSGATGTGKMSFSKKYAKEKAKLEPTPPDLCYVYNFKSPKEPKKIFLNAGHGQIFKEDMEMLVNFFTNELPKIISSSDFEKKKFKIVKKFQHIRDEIINEVKAEALKKNFGVRFTREGIYFVPIVEGEIITEEQFEALSDLEKANVEKVSSEIQEAVFEIMRELRNTDKKVKSEIEKIYFSECLFSLSHHIGLLIEKYSDTKDVVDYLNEVKEDVLENLEDIISDDSSEEESIQNIMPWYNKKNDDEILNKYGVNLLVDNSKIEGAPVIVGYNSHYANLMGEIEYDSEFGNLSTDFMKIKPGLLHKANGGYLILQASDILSNPFAWESLRRALLSEKITVEQLKEYSTGLTINCIKPEDTPLKIKVIIVGLNYYYEVLNYHDEEFNKLFKIRADFDTEMKSDENSVKEVIGFIKNYIDKEKLLDFEVGAVLKVVEHSERLAGSKNKLTIIFNELTEIILEASTWAKLANKKLVTKEFVYKAIEEKNYRNGFYEEKIDEYLDENIVMISTVGKKVGQINGLTVLDTGTATFGKPAKITATTCLGKAGVIDIENESEMSGNIHNKGVQVLTGYLGYKYAQDFPLSLSCRICFEQNYNGIDGDSASSAELYAIISSISQIPINQEIAVTGSINQFGEIQAIGGVNYKIEGFFDLCSKRGLTGTQGVIIPEANVNDLVLDDKVIESVKNGLFNIFAIKTVDEGLEILMNNEAGTASEKGKYPSFTIHGKVYKRLKDFHKSSM